MRNWRDYAECLSFGEGVFFAEKGGDMRAKSEAAKSICRRCDVRDICLEVALAEEEGVGRTYRHGVRGSMTAEERWLHARGQHVQREAS